MFRKTLEISKSIWPTDPTVLLYGAAAGMLTGFIAFALGIPKDQATALGIAVCLEFGLGLLIGAKLTILVTGAVRKKRRSLADRIQQVYKRLDIEHLLDVQSATDIPKNRKVETFMGLTYPIQMGTLLGSLFVLVTFTEFYTGTHGIPVLWPFIATMAALSLALGGITYQSLFLLWADRNLAAVEKQLDQIPTNTIVTFLGEQSHERYTTQVASIVSKMMRDQGTERAA